MMNSAGPITVRRSRPMVAAVLAFVLLVGWQVGQPLRAFADGPTTFSNSAAILIPATGSTEKIGPANPYPSNIAVSGMTGLVSKVTVTFKGLTHPAMNDVDALVVAPGGRNLMVLSDIGDSVSTWTPATDATIIFDDTAATGVPAGPRTGTGTFRPTNGTNAGGGVPDPLPAPAPTPSNQTTLAGAFDGIDPNGTWQLFVVDDDGTGDTGTMAGGWSLTITTEVDAVATETTVVSSSPSSTTGASVTFTASVRAGQAAVTPGTVQFSVDGTNIGVPVALNGSGNAAFTTSTLAEGTHLIRASYGGATGYSTSNGTVSQRVDNATVVTGNVYCNPGPLTISNGVGATTPYPSNITVSGVSGNVTKVTAQLKGLSHQAPIDLDVMLSGPTPAKNLLLLSDAGGQGAISNVDVTFADAAAGAVGVPLASGTFRPTRIADESTENFPPPAPAISSATELATFNGASPNGTWSLWVVDDATGDTGSISGGWCLTITTPAPTSTALTAVPNPSGYGQSVTFTATVTSGGNPVTAGSVQFTDGAANLGTVPVTNGVATFTTSTLTAGSHTVTASYEGTDEFAESSRQVTQVVNKRDTTTALASSANPAQVGSTVTFTATVAAQGGGAVSTGSVIFSIDGSDEAAVALNAGGTATLTTSALSVGTHAIEARYGGTANDNASEDDLDQVVTALESTTVVVSAPNPSVYGSVVVFNATVTTSGVPVTAGTVQFSENGTPLGAAVPLSGSGTASFPISTLSAGSHTITATYSGSSTVAGGSGTVDHQVDQLGTVVTLLSSANPANLGDSITFTATVTGGGSPVPVGQITFVVDGTDLGVADLDGDGQATFTTSALTAGSHQVVAQYDGSLNYAPSNSPAVTQVIQLVADAGGPYTVAEGDSVTLDGGDSTPGIDYSWDVNGDGTFDVDGIAPVLTWAQLEALGINDGPGVHTVTLRVSSGAVTMDGTATLTVVNTGPESVLTGDLTATVGVPFTIKVGADDPSSADMAAMFTYTVDWGDGSPVETVVGPADPPVTHTYTTEGSFDASFTATDKDGGTGSPTSVVVVASPKQEPPPSPSPSPSPTPTTPPDDDLPQTGTSASADMLLIGLGLLSAGAFVIVSSIIGRRGRRERKH